MRLIALCAVVASGVLCITCSLYAGTTGKIAGMVYDSDTGEPLTAVNVTVESTQLGGITNLEGLYHIVNVPPGGYSVKATMMAA